MELVGRWWNGLWGRLARRDIWLSKATCWQVRARQGDADSNKDKVWQFATEAEARAMVERLINASGPGEWKETTHLYRAAKRSPEPRPDRPAAG